MLSDARIVKLAYVCLRQAPPCSGSVSHLGCFSPQLGWPDKWETGVEWELEKNHCRWCPESGNQCGVHHQSPIDLRRSVAVEADEEQFNECIDVHWMQVSAVLSFLGGISCLFLTVWMEYHDSTCGFDQLVDKNAFVVDRHALKIIQPIAEGVNDTHRIGCRGEGGGRWGKIDFSKGFR